MTPDGGIYLSCGDPQSGPLRAFPLALRTRKMRRLYRFRADLGPDELADALQRGRQAAQQLDPDLLEPREALTADGQRVTWQ
eukprot:5750929-Pyramimonas_sp.AAC.2